MGMKEKMLTIAHCANANKGDEARFRYHNAKEIGHILALYIRRDEFRVAWSDFQISVLVLLSNVVSVLILYTNQHQH